MNEEEKAIEYVTYMQKKIDFNKIGYIYGNEDLKTVLKALEQKDKEIQELKEKWNKDTHTLQNQLDLVNADRVEKDKIIKKVYRKTNNVLYFNDDADYCSALWTILHTINPDLEEEPELNYIEESEE